MWMRTLALGVLRALALGLLRAWLAFVASSLFIGLLVIAWDGDNPLRSSELYFIGFAGGVVGAAMAVIYTIAEKICRHLAWTTGCYFAALITWCIFLGVVALRASGEGAWGAKLFAVVSLLAGIVAWPLFLRPPSRMTVFIISVVGLGMFALYGVSVFHKRLGPLP